MTVYRLPIRLPAKSALTWPVVQLVAYKPSQKLIVSSIPVGRTFFVRKKEKRKRRKPHLREKIGLCGERKLNLLDIKMMLRGSLTSDKNKEDRSCWKVPGAHTLLMSEGGERF